MKQNNGSLYKALPMAVALAFALMPLSGLAQQSSNFSGPDNSGWNINNFQIDRTDSHARVCSRDNNSDAAACDAHVVTDSKGNAKGFVTPSGYGPAQILGAYGLTGKDTSAKPTIIGIVDAYDDPNIASDLAAYDTQFGLPALPNCKTSAAASATPCLQKSDQNGSTHYPAENSGWDLEISLDVETAHAVCQNCSIALVEATSNSYVNLLTGVDRAITLGAKTVSNSWGGAEFNGETAYDSYLNKPGIAITFSSGDSGYGVEYPAASQYVTAVGGTSLTMNGLAYGSETAWSGGGSGCSAYESKPTWQKDTGCSKRTVADVSADADPNTGVAVYDSVRYENISGWFQVGGTSLSTQIIGAVYALSANVPNPSLPYTLGGNLNLHDVTSGSNGTCSVKYLCTAGVGYDGPTGLGSPNGIGAF